MRTLGAINRFGRGIERAQSVLAKNGSLPAEVDVGPNLGAINRAALIAADNVAVPLVPDLFSLQGLRNLGPTLRSWRKQWESRLTLAEEMKTRLPSLPVGAMVPAGYIVMQHAVRASRPTKAYDVWMTRIPSEYEGSVLGHKPKGHIPFHDPNCLAIL